MEEKSDRILEAQFRKEERSLFLDFLRPSLFSYIVIRLERDIGDGPITQRYLGFHPPNAPNNFIWTSIQSGIC